MRIRSAEFLTSATEPEGWPAGNLPEFAFIGRSNVGKSTLVNLLVGRRDLAKVSSKPGATRTINFYDIDRRWRLVDLPGYGYSKTAKRQREEFQRNVSDYLAGREALRCVFVLIDSRLPPQEIDLRFCDWLAVGGIPFVLVFTKTDKSKPGKVREAVDGFLARFAERVDGAPRVFLSSLGDPKGRAAILDFIGEALRPA